MRLVAGKGSNDFSSFSHFSLTTLMYSYSSIRRSYHTRAVHHEQGQEDTPEPQPTAVLQSLLEPLCHLPDARCACFRGGPDSRTIGAPVWCWQICIDLPADQSTIHDKEQRVLAVLLLLTTVVLLCCSYISYHTIIASVYVPVLGIGLL